MKIAPEFYLERQQFVLQSNMKTARISLMLAVAAALASGCNKAPETTGHEDRIPIRISSSVTKVAGDSFERNDAIGLYVVNAVETQTDNWSSGTLLNSDNHMDNVKYTYTDMWNADKEYYWKDSRTKADFYCYYPFKENVNDVEAVEFTTPADQSTLSAFKSCEILWGRAVLESPTGEFINIAATHKMSQLVIEIKPGKGFTDESLKSSIEKVRVNNIKCHPVLNIKTGKLTATGDVSEISPYYDGSVYKVMVAPQKLSDVTLVTVTVDGMERKLSSDIEFTSNMRKKCTITVNKISEGVNVSIGGWEDDTTDYGGTLN